jgi:hypothetical protein
MYSYLRFGVVDIDELAWYLEPRHDDLDALQLTRIEPYLSDIHVVHSELGNERWVAGVDWHDWLLELHRLVVGRIDWNERVHSWLDLWLLDPWLVDPWLVDHVVAECIERVECIPSDGEHADLNVADEFWRDPGVDGRCVVCRHPRYDGLPALHASVAAGGFGGGAERTCEKIDSCGFTFRWKPTRALWLPAEKPEAARDEFHRLERPASISASAP